LGHYDAIADYLAAEVLAALPPDLRGALVAVSVAECLTASLMEALTGRLDGARILAELDRRGAFVVRGAGPGGWYRLHPLLSRAAYAELGWPDPQRKLEAHRRAAHWYVVHGPSTEALRHLLAAGEWQAAVEVLDRHWPDVLAGTLKRSLKNAVGSPADVIHREPRPALAFAAERFDIGDGVGTRTFLHIAEDGEDGEVESRPPPTAMAAAFGLAEARLRGDMRAMLDLASQLMSTQPSENAGVQRAEESRTLALIATGAANLHLGALAEAGPLLRDGLALARQSGLAEAQVCAGSHLALWHADQGHLRAATHTARETLDLADRLGLTLMRDLGWVRLAQAEAHYQWDRLDEAGKLAEEALDDACGDSEMVVSAAVMLAKIEIAAGRLVEAHRVLDTARDDAMRAQVTPRTRRSVSLVEAELRLAGGDIAAARRRLSDWSGEEPLPAWSAMVHASLLLAQGKAAAAAAAVAPYLAETSSLTRAVQAGVLTALAGQALRDQARATRGLDIALKAAEEEGFRRSFSGAAGQDVRDLIDAVAPAMTVYRPVASELVQERDAPAPDGLATPATTSRYATMRRAEGTVETLTERELTVLRYLQSRLSAMEIASSLHISINTVKTHTRNIYRKLSAGGRREAVRRGRDLRLL